MKCLYEGTGVAIVTPFKNGSIDFARFSSLIQEQIKNGAKAIIVLGTTGEGSTVDYHERVALIGEAKKAINGKAKLIVGTGNNNYETCKMYTRMAKDCQADGVLVVTPYYNKTTQQGLIEYYTHLSHIGIPIIMYNVPSRTGMSIDIATVKELANNPMIYGIKEASCDINRIIELSRVCNDKIALYSGEDKLNYLFYCLGGNGSISVAANVCPNDVQKVFLLAKNGRFNEALNLQRELDELNDALFIETNPIPVKTLMSHMGKIEKDVRMPLVDATSEHSSLLLRLANRLSEKNLEKK